METQVQGHNQVKGFLKELLQSRHVRLKVECLLLIMYTMYHCGGLITLISNDLSDDDIDAFKDDKILVLTIACVFALMSVLLMWIFCAMILTQYHYKKLNSQWIKTVILIITVSGILWLFSMATWFLCILTVVGSNWYLSFIAIVPLWNKTVALALIYHIRLDLLPKSMVKDEEKNKIKRNFRVTSWLNVVTCFLFGYLCIVPVLIV